MSQVLLATDNRSGVLQHTSNRALNIMLAELYAAIGGGSGGYYPAGLKSDGTTNDYGALSVALTQIGATPATLVISGPTRIGTSISSPKNVSYLFIGNGSFVPDAGVTITIAGFLNAGQQQIFNISAAGSAVVGTVQNAFVYANWYGAVADGTTDSTIGLQAIAKLASDSGALTIYMAAGTYKITSTVYASGALATTFACPSWIGAETRQTTIDCSAITGGAVAFKYRGNSGRITSSYTADLQFTGVSSTVGVMIQGLSGYQFRRCLFQNLAEGITFHNEDAATFTEFVTAVGCNFGGTVTTAMRYRVTSGNNSFHGSGMDQTCTVIGSGAAPVIQIDDGARPYEAPMSALFSIINASTMGVTFTGNLAAGATSATLNANWGPPTGKYPVTLSTGEVALITLTQGATTATFTAIVFPATTAGTIPNVLINNANITSVPHVVDFTGGALTIELGSSKSVVIGTTQLILLVGIGVTLSAGTISTGINCQAGTALRVTAANGATDGSYSFVGGQQGYNLKPLQFPVTLATSNMLTTARGVNVQISAANYERRYQAIMDVSGLGTISPVVYNPGTAYFQSTDSNGFNTQGTGGAGLTFTGNASGGMILTPATNPLTMGAVGALNQTANTTTGTNSPWARPTGTYTTTFSNGDVRNVLYTNGSTTIDWSADARGGLSGATTTSITAYQLPVGTTSIYVYEQQLSSGTNGGGHIQF